MSDIIKKNETLADGNVLVYLKMNYLKNRTINNLMALLRCLHDSFLWVPHTVTSIDEKDVEQFKNSKAGDIISPNAPLRFKPDLLERKADGALLYPVFSQMQQIPDDYKKNFSFIEKSCLECIIRAKASQNTVGLVLDPFTDSFTIDFEIADVINGLK